MISWIKCGKGELVTLQKISYATYQAAFASMCAEDDMNAYLETSFRMERLKKELANKSSWFYLLYQDHRLVGYLKLNEGEAQTEFLDRESLEVERIYVIGDFQGQGMGRRMLQKAVDTAQERGKSYLWLGVWDKNEKALAFYKKNGFYLIGNHSFTMGNDVQNDFLLRKDL